MNKKGYASSFADIADVRAFKRAKANGMTDVEAFEYGDNGVGCFGDDLTTLKVPYVAVPPDDMLEKWGSVKAAKHKAVDVKINGVTKRCLVGDRMPWRKNIRNRAVIDLAPGAQKAFNLKPPFMVPASWEWA
jgi:hypothetical protein